MATSKETTHPAPRLMLLSGIPASGKSTYGQWLEREMGFLHLEAIREDHFSRFPRLQLIEIIRGNLSQIEFPDSLLDVEVRHGEVLQRLKLKPSWDHMFIPKGSAVLFVKAVRQLSHLVAIDWGFPPDFLPIVNRLQREGVQAWWFDGNRKAARQSFVLRKTVPIECFDRQMHSIQKEWLNIKTAFESRMIKTVSRGPTYMLPEKIFRLMFGPAPV